MYIHVTITMVLHMFVVSTMQKKHDLDDCDDFLNVNAVRSIESSLADRVTFYYYVLYCLHSRVVTGKQTTMTVETRVLFLAGLGTRLTAR